MRSAAAAPRTAAALDWDAPPAFLLAASRAARAMRIAARQAYRTRAGYVLVWTAAAVWALVALDRLVFNR